MRCTPSTQEHPQRRERNGTETTPVNVSRRGTQTAATKSTVWPARQHGRPVCHRLVGPSNHVLANTVHFTRHVMPPTTKVWFADDADNELCHAWKGDKPSMVLLRSCLGPFHTYQSSQVIGISSSYTRLTATRETLRDIAWSKQAGTYLQSQYSLPQTMKRDVDPTRYCHRKTRAIGRRVHRGHFEVPAPSLLVALTPGRFFCLGGVAPCGCLGDAWGTGAPCWSPPHHPHDGELFSTFGASWG